MNGMMQPHEYFELEARRRQHEAHEEARLETWGRMVRAGRARSSRPSRRAQIVAVASPTVVLLSLLAILL